mgnify:CR=1 FL=1
MASLTEIVDHVQASAISKVELNSDDISLIVNSLVYDGMIESFSPSPSRVVFKICETLESYDDFTRMPCGVCPVRRAGMLRAP